MTTLALIPGLLSNRIVWEAVAEAAAGRFNVHHADVTQCDSIVGMARSVLDAVRGHVIAVGHSMGGRVAMEMAHIAPDRVQGLVLADTGHHPKREGEEIKRHQMIDLGHRSMERLVDTWLPPMVDPARMTDEALMSALRAMALSAGVDVHERQICALIGRPNATAYLKAIACPVLLIVGRNDKWSPVLQHEEIAAAIPDAELIVIEGAGHFAPFERPREVAIIVTDWLDRRY